MGTSKSYGGPGGRPPLLPPWALPGGGGADPSPPLPPEDGNMPQAPGDSASPSSQNTPGPATPSLPHPSVRPIPPSVQNWGRAKRSFGAAISNRGRGSAWQKAGRGYVRALGGSRKAAGSARAAQRSSRALGRFLADVANRGIGPALQSLGLDRYVGQSPEIVMAAIANALAPEGSTREQAAARRAISDALKELYEKYSLQTGTIDSLNNMTAQAVVDALTGAVSSFIYRRWLSDLGLKIEQKAISHSQAVKLEREVKKYVRDRTRLDLKKIDVLKLNWKSDEAKALMKQIYTDAYSFLGGGE
jgi:hypothetical protein